MISWTEEDQIRYEAESKERKRKIIQKKLDEKPVCKIKRTDFGFAWNGKGGGKNEIRNIIQRQG